MNASTRWGPAWISTVAASPSRLTSVMIPRKRFRALAGSDRLLPVASGEDARDLARRHEPLAALGPFDVQRAVPFPPPEGLDADAEHLRRLTDPVRVAHRRELSAVGGGSPRTPRPV